MISLRRLNNLILSRVPRIVQNKRCTASISQIRAQTPISLSTRKFCSTAAPAPITGRDAIEDAAHTKEDGNQRLSELVARLKLNPKLQQQQQSIDDYNSLLALLVELKRPSAEFYKVISLIKQRNAEASTCTPIQIDADSIGYLVRGLAGNGELHQAAKMIEFGEQQSIKLRDDCYQLLIRSLLDRALTNLLRNTQLRGGSITASEIQSPPTTTQQSPLLQDPDFKLATEIALRMAKQKMSIDLQIVKQFMLAHNKLCDVDGCRFWLDLVERMADNDGRQTTKNASPSPLTQLYNLMVDTYCKVGQLDHALRLVQSMSQSADRERLFPNQFTFGSILQSMANLPPRMAQLKTTQVMQQMQQLQIPMNTATWNVILWQDAKNGRVEAVKANFERLTKQRLLPDRLSFNSLIVAHSTRVGVHPRNRDYFMLIDPQNKRRLDQTAVQRALDESMTVLAQMTAADRKDAQPNAKTLNTLMHLSIYARRSDMALQLTRDLEERYGSRSSSSSNNNSKGSLGANGGEIHADIDNEEWRQSSKQLIALLEGSQSAIKAAVPDDRDLSNPRELFDMITLNTLLTLHLRQRNFDQATQVLTRKMPQYGYQPDQWSFALLLRHLAQYNHWDQVEQWLELMRKRRQLLGMSGAGNLITHDDALDRILKWIRAQPGASVFVRQHIDWLRSAKAM